MADNNNKTAEDSRLRVCIPFKKNERAEFENLLDSMGSKKGPYLRLLVLRDLAEKNGKTV